MVKDSPGYEKLISVSSLPPLPVSAARLLQLALDPDVEIDDLATVIERDPPLNARLLGIANSAYYAPSPPVLTIREATIRVLGFDMVRNFAVGMSMTGGFSTAACPRFDLDAYWLVALGTADLGGGMARASSGVDIDTPATAHLVGLLHNIGELLLVHLWPEEMGEAYRLAGENGAMTLEEHQRDCVGLDRWQAGAFLCRHWELPSVIGETIAALGQPDHADRLLARLIDATRRWIATVIAGRPGVLQIEGVDATYSDYRASAFCEQVDDLRQLASSLG